MIGIKYIMFPTLVGNISINQVKISFMLLKFLKLLRVTLVPNGKHSK